MTTTKKAATKKAATKKAAAVKPAADIAPAAAVAPMVDEDLMKLFYIEETPPTMPLAGNSARAKALQRIQQIATDCPANGAIVIPTHFRHGAIRILNKELPAFKWQAFAISDNPDSIRIYKKEYKKKEE